MDMLFKEIHRKTWRTILSIKEKQSKCDTCLSWVVLPPSLFWAALPTSLVGGAAVLPYRRFLFTVAKTASGNVFKGKSFGPKNVL